MAYLAPAEFVTKMVDAGESKLLMSTRDTLIRSYMAGAILALAAAFAVTVTVNTGNPLLGAVLFPVGFILLYLLGFDLLTGVFTLAPLAVFDRRPGATWKGVMRNWSRVFCGNFAGGWWPFSWPSSSRSASPKRPTPSASSSAASARDAPWATPPMALPAC